MSISYKISAFTIYEYGQRTDADGNPHQEDALYPLQGNAGSDTRVFVVCDGMGGHDAGEVASEVVSRTIGEFLTKAIEEGQPCTNALIGEAVTKAYDALDEVCPDNGKLRQPGTTMTLLVLHPQGYSLAHMGDSRIYLFRPGADGKTTRILHRTRDHSLVNDLVECGLMTPEQALESPQRNVITRAIQPHQEQRHDPAIFHGEGLQPGDCFYLCTDGMLEQITDGQLCEIFSAKVPDVMTRTNMLRDEAINNSDNHSAYVVRIDAVEGEPDREKTVLDDAAGSPVAEQPSAAPIAQPPARGMANPVGATGPKAPTVMGRRQPVNTSPYFQKMKQFCTHARPRGPQGHPRQVQQGVLERFGLPSWTFWVLGAAVLVVILGVIVYLYLD